MKWLSVITTSTKISSKSYAGHFLSFDISMQPHTTSFLCDLDRSRSSIQNTGIPPAPTSCIDSVIRYPHTRANSPTISSISGNEGRTSEQEGFSAGRRMRS